MNTIGITGGIGSGKSEVCGYLRNEFDAAVIFTDNVGHDVMKPGQDCQKKIIEYFTDEILNDDGSINRKKLGDIVFNDNKKLELLNSIVHPAVWQEVDRRIEKARNEGRQFAVLETALPDGEFTKRCDEIWYVYSNREIRIKRLIASRDITEEKAESIMKNQLSEEEFRKICDFVVDNSGNFEDTAREIKSRLERY
jgi:dephospho-CoA kinase